MTLHLPILIVFSSVQSVPDTGCEEREHLVAVRKLGRQLDRSRSARGDAREHRPRRILHDDGSSRATSDLAEHELLLERELLAAD